MPDYPVLGSPIVLAQSSDQEGLLVSSYITPPIATHSPSIIITHSITPLQLVDEEQDIPMCPPGVSWPSAQEMLEKEDEGLTWHCEVATMAVEKQDQLVAVHGQQAVCTLGPPKGLFHPYPTVHQFLELLRQAQYS